MIANFATRSAVGKYGTILEIGGGSGNFKEYFQEKHAGQGTLIATDIVPTPHCDLAVDAMALPFGAGSLDNIVMQDVLHHIPYPLRFLAEAERVLRAGGRIVMTEPYVSLASRIVFWLMHPEPVCCRVRIFGMRIPRFDPVPCDGSGAFASNQAVPTRLFFMDRALFEKRFPALKIVARFRRSLVVYPLSGGFSGPLKCCRGHWRGWGGGMERVLAPLAGLMAFRLVVVLEKRA